MAAAAVAIASGLASAAQASVYTFDASNSDITVSKVTDLCIGCGLSASFSANAQALAPWDAAAPSDTLVIGDFIDWSVGAGLGGETYDVEVSLAFSTPDAASGSTGGWAGVGTILGIISGGILTWDGPGIVNFADGSVLSFLMHPVAAGGFGSATTTGVTFAVDNVAPVPLPAAGFLLLGAIGGLAAMRRARAART
jgi:hypothetical protein